MLSPQDGPILIEAVTIRVRGHSEHDDASYVPRELLTEWQEKDPIARFEALLRKNRRLTDEIKKEIDGRIDREIEDGYSISRAEFLAGTGRCVDRCICGLGKGLRACSSTQ
ncbi:uncharacterized protein METZ01_LOCUS154816 [marine metagenome]|uniref:Dehydrogenase E1 component domain-containing protein n=1 Tax=marine metagenome TaxID=408172 RepID=A0A382ALF2_9ZZZZ